MNRRNVLRTIAAAGFAGLVTPREQKAQQLVEKAVRGLPAPKIKDIQVIETAPAGRAPHRRQNPDRSGRALRLWLRHLHTARRPRAPGSREVPEAAADEPPGRQHRRHLATLLRQFVLEERPGAEQRHQRHRPGALGYQRPHGKHACLRPRRRQVPGSR